MDFDTKYAAAEKELVGAQEAVRLANERLLAAKAKISPLTHWRKTINEMPATALEGIQVSFSDTTDEVVQDA